MWFLIELNGYTLKAITQKLFEISIQNFNTISRIWLLTHQNMKKALNFTLSVPLKFEKVFPRLT